MSETFGSVPPQGEPSIPIDGKLTDEERTWGMLAHLSAIIAHAIGLPFVGPLIVWLIYKDKSAFVADQAKEALNFQIAVMIAVAVLLITCIGSPLIVVVAIAALIFEIMGAMEANKGIVYRYPYTIRLIT